MIDMVDCFTRDSQVVSLEIPRFPDFFGKKIDFFIVKQIRKNIDFSTPEKNREKSGNIQKKSRRSPCIFLAKYEKYLT